MHICALVLVGFVASAAGQELLDRHLLETRIDKWIEPYVRTNDFSGVILIAQGNRILATKSYGFADAKTKRRNTLETRFRIASVSKTLTAAAIELLIQRGKLGLHDPLERYITGIANGSRITIEQLLSHESGIGVLDTADRYRDCLPHQELLRRLRLAKPLFPPGTGDSYSNEGYFLLALIVEKISGVTYQQFLQENIFDPLKVSNSGSACRRLPPGTNATGYVSDADERALMPLPINEAVEIGPGSIYSTARDLYSWLLAVDTNPLFNVSRWEYPYGWGKRNYSGRDLIEQSGILEGFNAHVALYPKTHIYAVVLSNVQSGLFNRIPKDLEAVLYGGEFSKPPERKAVVIPRAALMQYAGEYATKANPYHQTIFLDNGKLAMRWGSYPFGRVLVPIAKDAFFFRYEYATVRFKRDDSGAVVGMSWQWGDSSPMEFDKLGSAEGSTESR